MTSLSLPDSRRRFLQILWLSAALHVAVIGLTRLPPQSPVPLPVELQVELIRPPGQSTPVPDLVLPPPPQPSQPPIPNQQVQAKPVVVPVPTAVLPQPPTPQKQALVQPDVVPAPTAAPSSAAPPRSATPVAALPTSLPAPSAASSVTLNVATHNAPGPQLNVPLAADMRYYQAKELDVVPGGLKGEPEMPQQAQDAGVGGRVELRLRLEADGTISESAAISVRPGGVFGELFKQSALAWARNQRLQPATRGGRTVRAILIVPVVFPETGD